MPPGARRGAQQVYVRACARICTGVGRLGRRDGRKSGSETVVLAAEVYWELKYGVQATERDRRERTGALELSPWLEPFSRLCIEAPRPNLSDFALT